MISRELAAHVLGYPVTSVTQDPQFESYVIINKNFTINIHELAHKSKEWVRSKGLEMFVYELDDTTKKYEARVLRKGERDSGEYIFSWWNLDTEPGAIFAACEWVRKEMK